MSNGRLVIGTDVRIQHLDGAHYSTHSSLSDDTLGRFSGNGRPQYIVGRKSPDSPATRPDEALRLTHAHVILLTTERSASRLVRLCSTLIRVARLEINSNDVLFVRLPEVIGTLLAIKAISKKAKFVANVVAEPNVYATMFGPFSKVASWVLTAFYTALAARASAAVYVTECELQKMLPYRGIGPVYAVSNVRIPSTALAPNIKRWPGGSGIQLVSTGTMNSNVKGFDTLIEVVARLRASGIQARLRLIGDGDSREHLENLAHELNVSEYIEFCGYVSGGEPVRDLLRECNLFVLASRQEGLPRAMIEAMASGIPAIGSSVGGIPELVPEHFRFKPGDAYGLATVVCRLSSTPDAMEELARTQLDQATRIVRRANSDIFARCISEL